MRLSPEEYQRGLLRWNDDRVSYWTSTSEEEGIPPDWRGPLTDPNASRVHSPPHRYAQLRAEAADPGARERALPTRWERLINNTVVTSVWTAAGGQQKLTHVVGYGFFHRLVIETPFLSWSEDSIVRQGDVVFRLVSGEVTGEEVQPMDQVVAEEGTFSIRGQPSGSSTIQGRFVEIVAPGASAEDAEQRAYALLGLAGLAIGDHVIGNVVFSEPYDVRADGQFGQMRIPVTAKLPREAEASELATVDLLLPLVLADSRMSRARSVALRWYERGIRSEGELDKIIAFFIGVESLVNAFAAEYGPLPEVSERSTRYEEVLRILAQSSDPTTSNQLSQRLLQPTLTERFRFYVARHSWNEDVIDTFRRLARLRNDALHGDVAEPTWEDEQAARDLLRNLLKAELGLLGELPTVPTITRMAVEYRLVGSAEDESLAQDTPE